MLSLRPKPRCVTVYVRSDGLQEPPAVVAALCPVPQSTDRAGKDTARCSTSASICLAAATQRGAVASVNALRFPTPLTTSYVFFFSL